MINTATYRSFFRLVVLMLLSFSLWIFSGSAANTPQGEKYIPITITKQLEPENGVIPVEIRCTEAHITAPNQLEKLDCTLKNNTGKNIIAASAILSIVVERDGTISKEASHLTIETLGEQEFKGINKSIGPGEENSLGTSGPTSYLDAVIKGVEISAGHVEFDDQTTLGDDETGSQIIRDVREGAAKYKVWLTLKHNGKSVNGITPLLERDQSLPQELALRNSNQELGAKAYRYRLWKIGHTRGTSEIEKLLK
ncbi:MAG: hypothetical protein ACRD63_07600 [Pyrinomonadaceae bacterium]